MSAKHFVLAVGFALLCAALAQASTVTEPGHFIVDLNNPGQGVGGWDPLQLFTDTVNTLNSSVGFTPTICVDSDAGEPNGDDPDCDNNDPSIRVNNGGGSSPFPPSFNAEADGGGTFDFQNDTSSPFKDILFVTNFDPNKTYTCASDIYSFCGFEIVPQNGGPAQLDVLFIGGSIPVANPEPSEYLVLLIGAAAIAIVHRARSRRRAA